MRQTIAVAVLLCGLFLTPSLARTQQADGWDPTGMTLQRAELERLLQRYEESASSSGYSVTMRERARQEAALIRARLQEGDFQVGDRVVVVVEGEKVLSDTFAVQAGRTLTMPVIGEVPMQGLLRSELEGHLTRHLGQYLRDPVVRARSLIRITVMGGVGRPGYYLVPTETLLTDVLMLAGGPGQHAQLTKMRIERDNRRVWESEPLQQAITEGRTLDQLSLRAGDRVVIPQASGKIGTMQVVQIAVAGVSLLAGVVGLLSR